MRKAVMFILPPLPFEYNALEPYFDARTLEIHYTKHHKAYCDKTNKALEKHPELFKKSLDELLAHPDKLPQEIRTAVINQGGGFYNHTFFWSLLSQCGGGEPVGNSAIEIKKTFKSFEDFKKQFSEAAAGVFGSGWAWLVLDKNGKLLITTTSNQDSPISHGLKPILTIDVWEHAYYLKYQNRRAEFIEAWWNVVDWEKVEMYFSKPLPTFIPVSKGA